MAVSVVAGLVGAGAYGAIKGFALKTFLATFAAFTGMSAVAKGLAPKPSLGARMRGITSTTREPAASRKMIYGEMRVGGHVLFIGNSNEGATPDNNYLHLVIAFASHEIESYEEIYFNEDRVWDKTGLVDSDWTSVLNVYTHDGSQTLADPQLVTDCFNWTNNHKLLGIAYVHLKMLWDGDKFPNGIPNITAKLKGKKVYDPRDISQIAETPSTWLWSDNPALVLRDYLTNRYGLDEDDTAISDEAVEIAADICETPVDLSAGGSQQRYRCNGQLDTANNIKTNIEYIIASMGGFLTYTGGKYIMRAASYVQPTFSFDESDIVSEISTQTRQSRRSQYNTVKGVYVSSEANYKVCDYPAQVSSTYSTQDGAPVELDMPLPFVVHNQQAQRLAKIALNKSRQHIVLTASFNLKALQIKVGDTIELSNDKLGFTNKVFEVVDYALQIKGGGEVYVDLTLIESAAAVYDWTTSDEIDFLGDGEVTLDNGRTAQPVSNLTGLEIGLVGPDATLQTAYRLSWDLPDTRFTGDILVSWYDVTGTLPQDLIQGFAGPEATEFLITGLEPGETYSFYVQTINLIGVKSDPTLLSNVLMEGDTTAPALPTQIKANGDYEGIILTWLNPADIDFKHVEVHVNDTNTTPAVGATPAAVVDAEQYIQMGLNGGDIRYFWLRSVDFSGNKSAYTTAVLGIATSIRIKNVGLLINQNAYPTNLPAPQIKNGEQYEIQTIGTSDFTDFGASANTIGITFTANRNGDNDDGTGTVEHTSYAADSGELALVGLNLDGTLRYGENASIIWNGTLIEIPFNSSNNFTVLTNLGGKQGWIAFDRNQTAPFDMSGTLPNLNVGFVYYFDGNWYYDDDSANPVQFTRTAFTGTTTGTDGTTTARLVALGTLKTGSADQILEGGLFTDPIDLGLVELPENFIDVTKFATQLESDTYVSGTSGWKIERNGNTEFNDITARGTIFATAGSISESVQIGGVDLNDYVARATGSLALLINKGGGGTTTNNGEGVLVGVEQGAAVNNQNGYITWDGAQVEIPANVTISGSTFATQLQNQQGFICFDANKETPFSVFSGSGYIDLDCAFVYKIGDQWYFDANDSATVGQTFTPSTLLGSDNVSATDLVALGYLETSTSDVILYGGLFGQPVPLELAAFPSDAIRSGTIGGITITDSKLYEGVGTFKDVNTGFYLDSGGDFSLKNKLFFDNSAGELTVKGEIDADTLNVVEANVLGGINATSITDGIVSFDSFSEQALSSLDTRFGRTGGFFDEEYLTGYDGTQSTSVSLSPVSHDGATNFVLSWGATKSWVSSTNISGDGLKLKVTFRYTAGAVTTTLGSTQTFAATKTQLQDGNYVYDFSELTRLEVTGSTISAGTITLGVLVEEFSAATNCFELLNAQSDKLFFDFITNQDNPNLTITGTLTSGDITADNATFDAGTNTTINVISNDAGESQIRLYGDAQGTGRLYVGQNNTFGGGIEYNGDNNPAGAGAGSDRIALFRVDNGIYHWTARNLYNSNNWEFREAITAAQGNINVLEAVGGVSYDPSGGGAGTDTATDVGLALSSGTRIVGTNAGYIRNLLEWNASSSIDIGQTGTSLISGINLYGGASNALLKYQNANGYTEIGPNDANFSRFYTDRPAYYFDKKIIVDEGIIQSFDEDLQLAAGNGQAASIVIDYPSNAVTFNEDLNFASGARLNHNTDASRDKIRVWGSSAYGIGMDSPMTYGHLGAYAMTFQMNSVDDRGWVFLDNAHTDAQGAMSLTTNGKMTVATSLSIGEGESITSPQSDVLYVKGNPNFAVMPTAGSEGKVYFSSGDLVNREHELRMSADALASDNYIKFAIADGTVGSLTEVMGLFGNNRVGIGTDSPDAQVDISATTAQTHLKLTNSTAEAAANTNYNVNFTADYSEEQFTIFAGDTYRGRSWIGFDNFGQEITFGSGSSGTQRMVIDSNGNFGINNLTPDSTINVKGQAKFGDTTDATQIRINASANSGIVEGNAPTGLILRSNYVGTLSAIVFNTNGSTEAMRIRHDQKLLFGTISVGGEGGISWQPNWSNGAAQQIFNRASTTSTSVVMRFRNGGTNVGQISHNDTSTSYITTSDARLKSSIVDAPSASTDIDSIQVRSFEWIASGQHQKYGMIAQELQTVAPYAVAEGDEDDDIMGVDYSKLVPMLIKEIQSLRARVAQLEGDK